MSFGDYFGWSDSGGSGGGGAPTITTVNTATYTVLESDTYLHVDRTSTGACTLTLPAAASFGADKWIKDSGFNAATFNITINPNGVETIDGEADQVITVDGGGIWVYTDGTNIFLR